MNISIYLKSIWKNLWHHKAYTLFCILGSMLTFIFIALLLQVSYVITGHTPPVINADKIVNIPECFSDDQGRVKWLNRNDIRTLLSSVRGYKYYTCSHYEVGNMFVNGQFIDNGVLFVDVNYWNVFQYNFVKGKPWKEEDSKRPYIIVNESFVKQYFVNDDALNKEVEFQGIIYKILGIVSDVSMLSKNGQVSAWISEYFNKNIATGSDFVETNILFSEDISVEKMKKVTSDAFNRWIDIYGFKMNMIPDKIYTIRDVLHQEFGGDFLLIGIGGILFILLIIPVLNIILLSMANTCVQVCEIGLKRALGAGRFSIFMSILVENLILVVLGTLGGIMLVMPICNFIDRLFLMDNVFGKMVILPELDWNVILLIVFPLSVLFSLLSGGIPAYLIVRRTILDMLKGGSKC